ncbi:high mobility group B protein 3-like [Olea europaea var. sylvestris]|uniref:high mobility group B protein 3-like n=1 Tax=Olea europaea var. sylvestris TaxID=158386 RepID=UPI000C1CF5CA|nr:high mobility group B protein 3-like [Olea europaea var. sylvestris]
MKGPKNAAIASKKLVITETNKKRKADLNSSKKEKASKKNSAGPKRPASAFFVFMEDFRKSYKENFPDNKSVAAVTKAGGEKWKSMPDSEKAPYVAKAGKRKEEYEIALAAFNKNLGEAKIPAESEKSSGEVHDVAEDEASS